MNCKTCGNAINEYDEIRRVLEGLPVAALLRVPSRVRAEIERRFEVLDAQAEQTAQRLRDLKREMQDALRDELKRDDVLSDDLKSVEAEIAIRCRR